MDNEVWKPINGFPKYEISNYGRVRRVSTGKLLNAYITGNGRLRQVQLYDENTLGHGRTVHRLVAEHFISGYIPGYQVEHLDGNKDNNQASNLKMDWLRRTGAE